MPQRVTDALVKELGQRQPVWVVVHVNHPRELSPAVRKGLAKLVEAGVPLLNQSVLLRGVNDSVQILEELSQELVSCRVFPYYLHHLDPVPGTARFRVSPERGLELMTGLARRVSGVALPQYVIDPPDGSGKVPVSQWMTPTP